MNEKLRQLFSFRGRANREVYWISVIGVAGLNFIFNLLMPIPRSELDPFILLRVALPVLSIVILLAAGTRRLHDRDKSAWWILPLVVLPLIFSVVAELLPSGTPAAPGLASGVYLLRYMIGIWALIELGCLKGTTGPNRFGPDPLAPTERVEALT